MEGVRCRWELRERARARAVLWRRSASVSSGGGFSALSGVRRCSTGSSNTTTESGGALLFPSVNSRACEAFIAGGENFPRDDARMSVCLFRSASEEADTEATSRCSASTSADEGATGLLLCGVRDFPSRSSNEKVREGVVVTIAVFRRRSAMAPSEVGLAREVVDTDAASRCSATLSAELFAS